MTKAKYTPEERRKVKAENLAKNLAKAKANGHTRKNTDRNLAILEGRKFYIGGTACKKCGCVIKFVSSYGCHYCGKIKGRERLAEGVCDKYQTPEKTKARLDRWRNNNREMYEAQWRRTDKVKAAARASAYRCKKRNQTPDLTTEEKSAIMEVYSLARQLTLETGVKHEVDHIIPVSRGGLHHPDNLQVLTKYDNQSKGNRQQQSSINQRQPLWHKEREPDIP